eukprot:10496631-Alexandrium_andersonii.AAC.1
MKIAETLLPVVMSSTRREVFGGGAGLSRMPEPRRVLKAASWLLRRCASPRTLLTTARRRRPTNL